MYYEYNGTYILVAWFIIKNHILPKDFIIVSLKSAVVVPW